MDEDLKKFLIEAHVRARRPIGELAKAYGVNRSWLYKLLARYRREGSAGLESRSRRPKRCPIRVADLWEDEIVSLHKELADFGTDAGAQSIHYHLEQRHGAVPSVSTIWRVLRARGFVAYQPQKRPKKAKRFTAALPNQCWQADVTHVAVAGGAVFEVLNIIDDHSRLCVASRAFVTTRAPDVVRTLHKAAATWGYPQSLLTDNGLIFTTQRQHHMAGAVELELISLGIGSKHSRPNHPQTCGKVERFHQTLKRFVAKKDAVVTKRQLQVQLDQFSAYYNAVRPHRGIGRRTPLSVFEAAPVKAHPIGPRIDCRGYRVRHDRLDAKGTVTLRHRGRLHHIPVGRPYARWRVILLVAGTDVRIIGFDGSPLRHLRLDLSRDYQPLGG